MRETNKIIEGSYNKFFQRVKNFSKVCPKCKSKNILVRRRKKPKFICQKCGNEFDIPEAKITYKTPKQKKNFGRQYYYLDE